MKLEQYLGNDFDRNVIDHSVRALKNEKGETSIYAHPSSVNGGTVDYFVVGNSLIEKNPASIGKLELCRFDFGAAVALLKAGKKVRRASWEHRDFFYLVPGSVFTVNRAPLLGIYPEGTAIDYQSHIDQRKHDGTCGVADINQADILAEDWEVVA